MVQKLFSNERVESCIEDFIKLKKAEKCLLVVDLCITGMFISSSVTFFFLGLYPQFKGDVLDKVIEVVILAAVGVLLAIFLIKRLLFPKICSNIAERIEAVTSSSAVDEPDFLKSESNTFLEDKDNKVAEALSRIHKQCKPVNSNNLEKGATLLQGAAVVGGFVLELLLVIDLFHDFGMSRAHGKFFATVDDTCEFLFTALLLISVGMLLVSHYSKKKEEPKKMDSEKGTAWFRKEINMLWISSGMLLLSFFARVIRALEGTSTIRMSVENGVFYGGFLLSIFIGLLDIHIGVVSNEDLLFSDLSNVCVMTVRTSGLTTDIVP